MKKPILVYLSLSNLLLKAFMLVASTASWLNWFHLFITLLEKNLLLSRVHLTLTNLRECPLVPLPLSSKWNSSSGLILLNALQILNTSIESRLFLLSSNDHKFNFCNLSSYDGKPRTQPPTFHGKGHSNPRFSAHVYCGQTVAQQLLNFFLKEG